MMIVLFFLVVLGWLLTNMLVVQELRPNFDPDEVKLDKAVV
jgi:cation transporter-like permease